MMHPACLAVMVDDLAPDTELGLDAKRQAFLAVVPQHRIFGAGTGAHVDVIRFQGHEPRHRQPAAAHRQSDFRGIVGRKRAATCHRPERRQQRQRQKEPHHGSKRFFHRSLVLVLSFGNLMRGKTSGSSGTIV